MSGLDKDRKRNQTVCFRMTPEERRELEEEIPAGRFATPEEVAQATVNLVNSPIYLTGQIIGLDGGYL